MELKAGERAKPPLNLIEISPVDIYSGDPFCNCAVDLFQAVAARYSQHSDTLGKTSVKSVLEEFRQGR